MVNIVNVVEQLNRCRAGGRCDEGVSPCEKKRVTTRSFLYVVTSVSSIGAGPAGDRSRQNDDEAIDERSRKSLRDWQGVRCKSTLGQAWEKRCRIYVEDKDTDSLIEEHGPEGKTYF